MQPGNMDGTALAGEQGTEQGNGRGMQPDAAAESARQ